MAYYKAEYATNIMYIIQSNVSNYIYATGICESIILPSNLTQYFPITITNQTMNNITILDDELNILTTLAQQETITTYPVIGGLKWGFEMGGQSNLDYLKTDGTNSMTGNLNMNSNKIINVLDPTLAQDGATKNYVDSKIILPSNKFTFPSATDDSGGYAWKDFLAIPSGITVFEFYNLPSGFYACTTLNLPLILRGILPTEDGYLTCYSFENGAGGIWNKRYSWYSTDANESTVYVASIVNGGWSTWQMQSPFLTSGVNPMLGNIDMNSNRIVNLQDPTFSSDGATKNYVDDRAYLFVDRFPPVDMNGLLVPAPFVVTSNNNAPSAWAAFSGVDFQDWLCSSPVSSWAQIIGDFRFVLKRLVIRGGGTGTITQWTLAGFNDAGGNFVVLADHNSPGGGNITIGTKLTIIIQNNTLAFSGYRFSCIDGTGTVSINYIGLYNGISNVDVYGDNIMKGALNMNNKKINNVFYPADLGDATNKDYVDTLLKKCLNGYIPLLEGNTSRLGFIASAGGAIINNYNPYGAFNSLNADGVNGSWVVATTTGWLQIKCPESIIIWRVGIKGRAIPGRNITAWNIQGSNDGTVFTNLITSTTTLLGSATAPSFFDISTTTAYSYYRLNITASVGATDVGIQVFQIYTYCQ